MGSQRIAVGRPGILIVLSFICAVVSAAAVAAAGDPANADGKDSAYGVVLRMQSSGNRVMIQPLEGSFVENADVQYRNGAGDVVCAGKVQRVYSNLVYSVAEGCDRFDDLRPGFGATYNTDGRKMRETYNSKDKIDEVVRENEWKKSLGVPLDIGEDQFENMVKKSKVPVFFEVYATWCPRCDEFKPILGEVAKDLEGNVRVAITDEANCAELKKMLNVKSYPALFVFVDGVIVDEWRGAYREKKAVIDRINYGLSKSPKGK